MNNLARVDWDYGKDLEDRINAHLFLNGGVEFYCDQWNLDGRTIDFSVFDEISSKGRSNFIGLGADLKSIAKILTCELSRNRITAASLAQNFDTLFLFFNFFSLKSVPFLDFDNLVEFFEYYSMHTISQRTFLKRMTPRSGTSVLDTMKRLLRSNYVLSTYGIGPVMDSIRHDQLPRMLSDAIDSISMGSVSYRDWLTGGTFNNITLDYGRYYVEFCDSFFKQHYPMASAMVQVSRERDHLIARAGFQPHKNTVNMFNKLLSGEGVDAVVSQKPFKRDKVAHLSSLITDEINSAIAPIIRHARCLDDEVIHKIASRLHLNTSNRLSLAEKDKVRTLVDMYFWGDNAEVSKELLGGYNKTLSDLKTIIGKVSSGVIERYSIQDADWYNGIGITRDPSEKNLSDTFIKRVKSAGLTTVVALTGWRGSEYGFPLTAVKLTRNTDALDQLSHPVRVFVNWHVFKTNGKTRIRREITYGAYQVIRRVHAVIKPEDVAPCLYALNMSRTSSINSHDSVATAVADNWDGFVFNYDCFKVLDRHKRFKELTSRFDQGALTPKKSAELEDLDEEFSREDRLGMIGDPSLREAWERARNEYTRVSFHLRKRNIVQKRHYLSHYRLALRGETSELGPEVRSLLDTYLTDSTKEFIRKSTASNVNNRVVAGQISNELIDGCMFPTPHAFRHMWAEAVFRRFDGDAGWMIRSNFKHISNSMWLAYIDGKGHREASDRVRRRVASSLLKNWIRHEGRDSSGKLNRALHRVFASTKLLSLAEIDNAIEDYATIEIDSIKANPWGYCISRRRSASLARCSSEGYTQLHKARPSLCLTCVNNITNSSNIDYIVFQCHQHIDLLESEYFSDIPDTLLDESLRFVVAAQNIINDIEPDHRILPRMRAAVSRARKVM